MTPVAAATAPAAAPQEAMQDAPAQQPEIVVSGFRGSLVRAQDIKRKSINLTESILAEDMAKMPDLNLSESIQRLPGVAISREGGEGRNITTLNGMEVPASSDGLDSGGFTINAGRAFDFHIFASELFNRVDVQKTQRASIEEGGIAGTVDLYSAKPFDFNKPQAVISAQRVQFDYPQGRSPRHRHAFRSVCRWQGRRAGVCRLLGTHRLSGRLWLGPLDIAVRQWRQLG